MVPKYIIFCYADDITLLAPIEKAIQSFIDTLDSKLKHLSLETDVEK